MGDHEGKQPVAAELRWLAASLMYIITALHLPQKLAADVVCKFVIA